MAPPKPFDMTAPHLATLRANLTNARIDFNKLRIEADSINHELALEGDRLIGRSAAARRQAQSNHDQQKDRYNRLMDTHKLHIEKLMKAIEVAESGGNWQSWSSSELLIRWLAGLLDYSIFKSQEPARRLHEAFRDIEHDLIPPPEGRILHVSAEVAAGWYEKPIESPFWNVPRDVKPGYETEYTGSESGSRSVGSYAEYGDEDGDYQSFVESTLDGDYVDEESESESRETRPRKMSSNKRKAEFLTREASVDTSPSLRHEYQPLHEQEADEARRESMDRSSCGEYMTMEEYTPETRENHHPRKRRRREDLLVGEIRGTVRAQKPEKWVPMVYGSTARLIKATEYVG
ncbi:hypothetical protein QTJ16_003646 [Diplocarpon rosae]|uniref:Uncharacterized protein n=1 Tax=Diplocarpon rosae TaxID=946125 RepID=A0AAD9SZI2_9HELO|nr:hypothetical protein QTJ16_003646 [Diplocarpon rosae]